MSKRYYIYMIYCKNHSYYTGYTTDIYRRYEEHCAGSKKSKYTRAYPPIALSRYWCIEGKLGLVMKIERLIKALSKSQKTALVNEPTRLFKLLSDNNIGYGSGGIY